MTKLRLLLVLFSLLMFAVLAHAQGTVITPNPRGAVIGTIGGFAAGSFAHGNTGLPFSADVVEENDKFLADGNHIHNEILLGLPPKEREMLFSKLEFVG